jgi:hypothetical protein
MPVEALGIHSVRAASAVSNARDVSRWVVLVVDRVPRRDVEVVLAGMAQPERQKLRSTMAVVWLAMSIWYR